jgi:hypothetical protein
MGDLVMIKRTALAISIASFIVLIAWAFVEVGFWYFTEFNFLLLLLATILLGIQAMVKVSIVKRVIFWVIGLILFFWQVMVMVGMVLDGSGNAASLFGVISMLVVPMALLFSSILLNDNAWSSPSRFFLRFMVSVGMGFFFLISFWAYLILGEYFSGLDRPLLLSLPVVFALFSFIVVWFLKKRRINTNFSSILFASITMLHLGIWVQYLVSVGIRVG